MNFSAFLLILTMISIARKAKLKRDLDELQKIFETKKRKLNAIYQSSHSYSKASTQKEYHPFNSSCRKKALNYYKRLQLFSESALKG